MYNLFAGDREFQNIDFSQAIANLQKYTIYFGAID